MTEHPVIVLGDDGWDTSSMAHAAAIDLARRSGAKLVLVHAIEHEEDTGRRARRELEEILTSGCREIDTEVRIAQGDAVDVLLETARQQRALLLVTGHEHRGRLGRWMFGSVAQRIMDAGETPLLVVPEESSWPPVRFLVGEDGSDAARAAGDLAGRMAAWLEAQVRLIETLPRSDLFGDHGGEHHVIEASRHLRRRAGQLAAATHRPAHIEVHFSDAAEMLERLAEHTRMATCIAVGRRPRRGAEVPLPPYVSDALLQHGGHCLLVHPTVRVTV